MATDDSDSADSLSADAEALLAELQTGPTFAEPSVYPGSFAFNDHAIAFLNNAAALCRTGDMDDFRIFGALYCMRHGIELWLKAILQSETLDKVIDEILGSHGTVKDIATAAQLHIREVQPLERALCVFRNVWVDKLPFPENQNCNVGEVWGRRAIEAIRERGYLRKHELATLWCERDKEHGLSELWERAKGLVSQMAYDVAVHAQHAGEEPLAPDRIGATCELLARWDAGGNTFRYPRSLDGAWHFDLPHLNLERLGALADELESTVRCYDSFLRGGV